MAGIAQQRDIAFSPARTADRDQAAALCERRAGSKHAPNLRMETGEGGAQLLTSPVADQDSGVNPGSGWLVTK